MSEVKGDAKLAQNPEPSEVEEPTLIDLLHTTIEYLEPSSRADAALLAEVIMALEESARRDAAKDARIEEALNLAESLRLQHAAMAERRDSMQAERDDALGQADRMETAALIQANLTDALAAVIQRLRSYALDLRERGAMNREQAGEWWAGAGIARRESAAEIEEILEDMRSANVPPILARVRADAWDEGARASAAHSEGPRGRWTNDYPRKGMRTWSPTMPPQNPYREAARYREEADRG